jgi:capsular polysaccharide transport system permease protein
MNSMLIKMKRAVELRGPSGPAVLDVRSSILTFRTYKYVLMAVAVAAFYYLFLASDIFVARAQVYVKSTSTGPAIVPQLQFLGGANPDTKDTLLTVAYIGSQEMLNILEKKLGLSAHFSSSDRDFYARMPKNPSNESRYKYYRKHVSASYNADTGIIKIKAQGFTPAFALEVVKETITASETFINGIGQHIAVEEIAFVEGEMARARDHVQKARANLLRFQNENGILSAEASGASRQAMVDEMESNLVRMQTQEKTLSSYLNSQAAELVAVRGRIGALSEQLVIEREKLASQDGVSANDINAAYQALELDLQFATDMYQTTLVSLERARIESYKKLKHLVVVQAPQLPDEAVEPRKVYNIISLFVALSLIYGVSVMIIATIREHRDV